MIKLLSVEPKLDTKKLKLHCFELHHEETDFC